MRWLRIGWSVPAAIAPGVALACSCVPPGRGPAGDRAGERIYRSADLIVDATVLPARDRRAAQCRAPASGWLAANRDARFRADRPLRIHRVLKGRAPAGAALEGLDTIVTADGCGTTSSTCDVAIDDGTRGLLVLRRTGAARFTPIGLCEMLHLRESARGRRLFAKRR